MPRVPRGGLVLLAFLSGLLGAAAAVALLSLGRPSASELAPSFSGLESLDRHVQELTAALRDGLVRPAVPQAVDLPDESRYSPIEPLQTSTAEFAPLLDRLDALIARLETAAAGDQAPFRFPDSTATELARRELRWTNDAEFRAIQRSHRLMTYRQIAERYGLPDEIRIDDDGSVAWTYRFDEDQHTFTFIDGLSR